MAIEQFGNTWWGQQWLDSLTKIDFDNRLPRGKTYARKGMVADIELKNTSIYTTVKGSRPRPYKVSLSMGAIDPIRIHAMLDDIIHYPSIVSQLLNGKMPPQLIELAAKHSIKIFPNSSSDMDMECSCPDWAVPCKHLAASIYKVSTDIDNNPFVLFEFRGIDIVSLLEEQNISIDDIQDHEIITENELVNSMLSNLDANNYEIPKIDYSSLNNMSQSMLSLLEEQPPFYALGNFKTVYSSQFAQVQKTAQKILNQKADLIKYYPVKDKLKREVPIQLEWKKYKLHFTNGSPGEIWDFRGQDLELCTGTTQYIATLYRLAMHCIANGLVHPSIIKSERYGYSILWKPVLLYGKLSEIIEKLDHPGGVITADQSVANGLLSLSYIITDLIHHLAEFKKEDPFINLFFKVDFDLFDGLSEGSIPKSISRWLKLFEFDLGDYFPVLKVEDQNDSFMVDIQIDQKTSELSTPVNFTDFVNSTTTKTSLFDFYKDLDLLSTYIPGISTYIDTKGLTPLHYTASQFPEFLFSIQPIMKLLGIKVVLPKALKNLIRPRSSIKLSTSEAGEPSGLISLSKLLDFDWKVSLGNEVVSTSDFRKLVKQAGSLIKYKGQYIYIDEQDLLQLYKETSTSKDLSNIELLSVALSGEYKGGQIEMTKEVQQLIQSMREFDLVEQPAGLLATFRPYQHRGFSWMVKNTKIGIGSIIADDMGLGKTLQVIALVTYLVEQKQINTKSKALIILPTSLLPNWESEFEKFAPCIKVDTFYGPSRDLSKLGDADVILTTYGTARSDIAKIKKEKWALTVIDEAQNIKNPTAQQTKAIKSIPAANSVAMSGTPVENRLMDYWSVMDFVNKGLLGNKTRFKKEFDTPISKNHNQEVLDRFIRITSPFIMRRMKTDKSIISDLPDKIMSDTYAHLMPAQSALYEKVVQEALEIIDSEDKKEDTSLFKRQGLILQMITALKQICNHPGQWLKNGDHRPEQSGKLRLLVDTMSTVIDGGDKAIIFTQFREMGDIISACLTEELGITPLWLHGGVSMKKRQIMVEDFQGQAHQKIMILSLKAGGTGLNLTAANHVIHYDLWWNPAVEAQATDRAFRIGQNKNVFVHRFITKHTFEEKIDKLIKSKMELANLTVKTGESWIGDLGIKELKGLFEL